MLETCRPMDIEARSFEIITELLGDRELDPENAPVIKRAIHTTADFDYADNLVFSPHAVQTGLEALRSGCDIVTDTQMAKAGINKTILASLGGDLGDLLLDEKIHEIMLKTPNLPDKSLPIGTDDSYNRPEKYWHRPTTFTFKPKSHWELGQELGYFDVDRAAKVTGSRFTFYLGAFARLERCLASFMLDTHVAHGFTEVLPPYLVNTDSLTGSGQLPKFADQAYMTNNTGDTFWLIPTAEVPVTNYYRNEILMADELPKWFAAYSSCSNDTD